MLSGEIALKNNHYYYYVQYANNKYTDFPSTCSKNEFKSTKSEYYIKIR